MRFGNYERSIRSTPSAICPTSLPMAFAIPRSCAEAIRASSCVSLSSFFSASSMSLFPISFFISFFTYFSENRSINVIFFWSQQGLTYSTLFHFFCSDGENVKNFNYYCRDRVQHSLIWRHFSVYVQTSEKCFYALEHLEECVLVRANVLSCLRIVRITTDRMKGLRKVHTENSTPKPIKITFAGGNTCQ